MTIALTPDLEQKLARKAQELGTTPENFVLSKIQEEFAPPTGYRDALPPPRDDWERELRSIAVDCGVSLTDEQVSRDSLYDDHL